MPHCLNSRFFHGFHKFSLSLSHSPSSSSHFWEWQNFSHANLSTPCLWQFRQAEKVPPCVSCFPCPPSSIVPWDKQAMPRPPRCRVAKGHTTDGLGVPLRALLIPVFSGFNLCSYFLFPWGSVGAHMCFYRIPHRYPFPPFGSLTPSWNFSLSSITPP